MAKKTPEQKADEERRYALARSAVSALELAPFVEDPNQGIRSFAAMNPHADAQLLDRFADDKFWGVRMEVARHAHVEQATLFRLVEPLERKRGVVHHAAKERLEKQGVKFGADGMPTDDT